MRIGFQKVRVRVTSGDIAGLLRDAPDRGVLLYDVVRKDHLTAIFTIEGTQYRIIEGMCKKRGDKCELLEMWGIVTLLSAVLKQWVLIIGILILLFLSILLPRYALFFEISGNQSIPDNQIYYALSSCGIQFGSSRRSIRSEQIKNSLIEQIPELDWVGITTNGCVVNIQVRERETDKKAETKNGIRSIVAAADGTIVSVTATKGVIQCKPGQVVKKGELLISGYEDCGILIRGLQAEGEVFAKTFRSEIMKSPSATAIRTKSVRIKRNYSLQIGKKLINFNNSSGISPTGCVKIEKIDYLTLPGGFQLPIALIREDITSYRIETNSDTTDAYSWLPNAMIQYVNNQMIAGTIEQHQFTMKPANDHCVLYGNFYCTEEIGKTKIEEILKIYGQNN